VRPPTISWSKTSPELKFHFFRYKRSPRCPSADCLRQISKKANSEYLLLCGRIPKAAQLRSIFLLGRIKSHQPASIYCLRWAQLLIVFWRPYTSSTGSLRWSHHKLLWIFYWKLIYKFFFNETLQDSVKNRSRKQKGWRNWFGVFEWGYFRKKLKLDLITGKSTSPW